MKHASLLIAFCALFSFSAVAQSTPTTEKNTKRITITTKKVDESGKTISETWIAEGNEPEKILQEMAINPDVIKKVEVENGTSKADDERLFLFRSAGDKVAVEGRLNENGDQVKSQQITVIRSEDGHGQNGENSNSTWYTHSDHPKAFAYVNVGEKKSNCAALGVMANGSPETGGAKINTLIEKGGAQEAGLKEGDIITKVDEYAITDFATLYQSLSNFMPGDRVTVRYIRSGKDLKAKVLLKDWAELPGFEWRSREDCGKQEPPAPVSRDLTIGDNPTSLPNNGSLVLENTRIYPNPTDGVFALSFNTAPGPLSVTISDLNGKVFFNEENENATGTYSKDIDLKAVPQGNYVICVKQGDKIFTQQISKQ